MDMEDGLASAFVVERRLWQAIVLLRLTKTSSVGTVDVWDLMQEFRKRDWPKMELLSVKSDESWSISSNVAAEFRSPYEEIRSYLKRLKEADMVFAKDRSRFQPTTAFRQRLEIARLPESNRADLLEAFEDIQERMTDVDGALPDFDDWLAARSEVVGETLVEFLLDEEGNCSDLLERLQAVYREINHPKDDVPPDDFADLPLETLFWRLLAERGEARERAEAEQERRRTEQVAARVARIRSKLGIEPAIGVVGPEWLEASLADHGDKTPLELAAGSAFGLEQAETALNLEVWARKSAARAVEHAKAMYQDVEEAVRRRFTKVEEGEVWLKQSWPQLGGVRASVYCVDEKARDRCLQLLDETAPVKRAGRR
jgi:phosphoglycolate phosphatase-like HAD superfamily hydrolase